MQLATQRKDPEESVYIAALAGLFFVSYLPIVALSSSVYWLEACRTAVCFIHIVRDTLVRVVNNKSLLPEREREESPIMPFLRSIQVSFLKYCYTTLLIHTWVACSQQSRVQ